MDNACTATLNADPAISPITLYAMSVKAGTLCGIQHAQQPVQIKPIQIYLL